MCLLVTHTRTHTRMHAGLVPAVGHWSQRTVDQLWSSGRVHFVFKDGSVIRLCKLSQLKCAAASVAVEGEKIEKAATTSSELEVKTAPASATATTPATATTGATSITATTATTLTTPESATSVNADADVLLSWMTTNPGRQLLTGSFHPLDEQQAQDVWEDRRSWDLNELNKALAFPALFHSIRQRSGFSTDCAVVLRSAVQEAMQALKSMQGSSTRAATTTTTATTVTSASAFFPLDLAQIIAGYLTQAEKVLAMKCALFSSSQSAAVDAVDGKSAKVQACSSCNCICC